MIMVSSTLYDFWSFVQPQKSIGKILRFMIFNRTHEHIFPKMSIIKFVLVMTNVRNLSIMIIILFK